MHPGSVRACSRGFAGATGGPPGLEGRGCHHSYWGPAGLEGRGTPACLGYHSGSPAWVHHCTGGPLGLQWGVSGSDQWPARACRGAIHHHARCPAGTPKGGGAMAHQGPTGACKGESTVVTRGPLGLAGVVQRSYQGPARACGQGGTTQLPGAHRASKGESKAMPGGLPGLARGGGLLL